jgi:signal transduction histidine kinase
MSYIENSSIVPAEIMIKRLTERVQALEELLEVSEQAFLDGASNLEAANAKLEVLNEKLFFEINERKKAEEAARLGERFLSNVFSAIQDGISVLNRKMYIIRVNEIMGKWFSHNMPLVGKKCYEAYHLKSQPCENCPVQKSLDTGKPAHNIIPVAMPDGNAVCWLEVFSFPIIDETTGETISVVEFIRDITDRRHAEEKLNNAYSELKQMHIQLLQSEKMASIGQLAAGVAHEINNPTGYVLSNLSSLQKYFETLTEFVGIQTETLKKISTDGGDGAADILETLAEKRKMWRIDYIMEDTGQLIDETIEGSMRIKQIVQNLRSFSHIDESESKPADINAGLESTLAVIWNELKYKATVMRDYGDIPLTECNLGQLNQVFMNLLINAVHAIEEHGQIIIKTRCDESTITVSVSDTGCGIPPEKISRIFEPFFTTKEVGKGTGLGLSIAYDIVKKHNGEIKVESEPGKGTTFTVSIPVV